MLLSQTSEYALRAVLHLAAQDHPLRVEEISAAIGVPRNYLSKTLHRLAHTGVLLSARGPSGGFRLAVPPSQLTLNAVLAPFDFPFARRCLLGRGECGTVAECAAHAHWSPVAKRLGDFFATTTVADLASQPSPLLR